MIDTLIPLRYYYTFFINSILCLLSFTLLHTVTLQGNEGKVVIFNRIFGYITFGILVLYIGLRPVSEYYFVDMATYSDIFMRYKYGATLSDEGDIGFNLFTYLAANITTLKIYFVICALLYVIPLFLAAKKWFPHYYFFVFLMLICSFSFYTYGVNGMRNGMATSFFIAGLAYNRNLALRIFWFSLSILFHKSMFLPLLIFITTYFYQNTKTYFYAWLASIALSVTLGSVWISLFTQLGFGDDRLTAYLNKAPEAGKFSSTGFRWDFLVYSAIPIVLGYFYVFKLGFKDKAYERILQTYLVANAFWVMVIRANFSNRFAYLSWFMMAVVIFYPPFKQVLVENQFRKIGYLMVGYFTITYILTVVLK